MSSRHIISAALAFILATASLGAQQRSRTVTGTVKDESGEALMGATVTVKGGSNKNYAITDLDGRYSITASMSDASVLVYSFLGMQDSEYIVGTNKVIDIVLKADRNTLEEAVISAGYGLAQKRSDMTGSAYQVSAKQLETLPAARIDNLLDGMVPGLTVDEGTPGARSRYNIRVRGDASLSANCEPLWVVDGVPIYTGSNTGNSVPGMSYTVSPLSFINPDDIESITVLKDAATTSLYGADGANGVILVTTRQGSGDGKVHVSANVKYGVSKLDQSTMIKYCNAEQWLGLAKEAWTNAGYKIENFPYQDNEYNRYSTTDTFWQDVYLGMGNSSEIGVKVESGGKNAKNYLSANYYREQSTTIGNLQQRFAVRERTSYNLGKKLKADINLSASYNLNDIFYIATNQLRVIPIFEPYDLDGHTPRLYNYYSNETDSYDPQLRKFVYNEVPVRDLNDNTQRSVSLDGNANLNYTIFEGLTANAMFGISTVNNNEEIYSSKNTLDGKTSTDQDGSSRRANSYSLTWNSIERLNFNRRFGKHGVGAMAGLEFVSKEYHSVYATGYGFANDDIKEIGYAQEASRKGSSSASNSRSLSYLANASYNYDSRYYLSASYRRQGYSSFSKYSRWGDFASIGFSWNVHNEKFWNVGWMDKLKIKTSYGNSGNSRVDTSSSYGTYTYGTSDSYGGMIGATQGSAPNPGLSWENTDIFNIGLDMSFFGGRLEITPEFYDKYTHDLLYDGRVSSIITDGKVTRNVGEIENQGFEIEVMTKNIDRKNFSWTTQFNGSVNRNIIRKLYNGTHTGFFDYVWMEGASKSAWWLSRWAGVDPANGAPMWYDPDGNLSYTFSYNNRVLLPEYNKEPDFRGGMRNTWRWGDFSFMVFLTYTIGGWDYCNSAEDGYDVISWNVPVEELDHWRQPGDVASNPRYIYKNSSHSTLGSTRFLYSKTNIQLKNVVLSYNLPKSACRLIGASSANASLIADNLYFWTPDQSRDRNSYKTLSHPMGITRAFSAQLNINF